MTLDQYPDCKSAPFWSIQTRQVPDGSPAVYLGNKLQNELELENGHFHIMIYFDDIYIERCMHTLQKFFFIRLHAT